MAPLLLLLFVAPGALSALVTGRGGGATAGGRKPAKGLGWDRNGTDAREILREYIRGTPNYQTWDAFKVYRRNWIISKDNPDGKYDITNLNRNYKKLIERYNNHMNPNMQFDGATILCFFFVPVAFFLY